MEASEHAARPRERCIFEEQLPEFPAGFPIECRDPECNASEANARLRAWRLDAAAADAAAAATAAPYKPKFTGGLQTRRRRLNQ